MYILVSLQNQAYMYIAGLPINWKLSVWDSYKLYMSSKYCIVQTFCRTKFPQKFFGKILRCLSDRRSGMAIHKNYCHEILPLCLFAKILSHENFTLYSEHKFLLPFIHQIPSNICELFLSQPWLERLTVPAPPPPPPPPPSTFASWLHKCDPLSATLIL